MAHSDKHPSPQDARRPFSEIPATDAALRHAACTQSALCLLAFPESVQNALDILNTLTKRWQGDYDAVLAEASAGASRIVQVVQVGDGLSHGEEYLASIELAPKWNAEKLACAPWPALKDVRELFQPLGVTGFQLCHALVRAAVRLL